jgi:hypothetical protein
VIPPALQSDDQVISDADKRVAESDSDIRAFTPSANTVSVHHRRSIKDQLSS